MRNPKNFSSLEYKLFLNTWKSITTDPFYYKEKGNKATQKTDFSSMQNVLRYIDDISEKI